MHVNKAPRGLQIDFHIFGGLGQACPDMPKVCQSNTFKYLGNRLSYCFKLLHVIKGPEEHQFHCHIFGYHGQACLAMLKVCRS